MGCMREGRACAAFHVLGSETGRMKSSAAFVYDARIRDAENAAGRNYWYEYVREILDRVGLTAGPLPPGALADEEALAGLAVVIVGGLPEEALPRGARSCLERWVAGGGVLISFGTGGLDELFGNEAAGEIEQPGDFEPAARFAFTDDATARDIHSVLHPEQKLLIFSDVRKVRPAGSAEIARLFTAADADTGCAAVTGRNLGEGRAFYFAFDVAKTFWIIQQGRPVDADRDGDGYLRMSDAVVIRPNEIEVMYTDEVLFLLQNMLAASGLPLIHRLPPLEGDVPDALFFWGGDDEGVAGSQVFSSNWMREHGLPYHINAMPRDGRFSFSIEEARQIEANGHEISLHYNFIDGYEHPLLFTRGDVEAQAELFKRTFGRPPVCSVLHWCLWTGWQEPARWMMEAGGKADNSRIHASSPPLNPANMLGFSFGTAFPFYIYDDYRGRNRKLDFLIEPITAYEVGHLKDGIDPAIIHKCIDTAVRYHLTMNMFYHPVNIVGKETCRAAIEEVLRYIAERNIAAVHMGNDELWAWWHARTEAEVSEIEKDGRAFTAECPHERGMIVKVPLRGGAAGSWRRDGEGCNSRSETIFGREWVYLVCPQGRHRFEAVRE